MDLPKVLQQLHEELENLNAAIVSLERLQEKGRRSEQSSAALAGYEFSARVRSRRKAQSKPGAHRRK